MYIEVLPILISKFLNISIEYLYICKNNNQLPILSSSEIELIETYNISEEYT